VSEKDLTRIHNQSSPASQVGALGAHDPSGVRKHDGTEAAGIIEQQLLVGIDCRSSAEDMHGVRRFNGPYVIIL
jgi:hypothetical protein